MQEAFSIDPEFRDLLPKLNQEERERLTAEINANGCRDALVIWKEWNILIDGHNRYEICTDLGLPFETTEMSFPSRSDVMMWMFRNQLGRRNLTDFQRAEIALRMKPVVASAAKERVVASGTETGRGNKKVTQISDPPLLTKNERSTDAIVAKEAGVSRDTVRKVEKILAKASPEVIQKVRTGERDEDGKKMTVNRAYREIPPNPADIARDKSFRTVFSTVIGKFTKTVRELAEMPDADRKFIAYELRTFLKEFE